MRRACRWSLPWTWRTRGRCSCRCSRCDVRAWWGRGRRCRGVGRAACLDRRCRGWARAASFPGSSSCFATNVVAASGCRDVLAVVDDEFASREDFLRVALHLPTLEHGVVAAHVVGCGGDEVVGRGVPEDDVGVGFWGDDALLWIHAEDPGGSGGGDLDEALEGYFSGVDAMMKEQLHAVFDAGAAVGDL